VPVAAGWATLLGMEQTTHRERLVRELAALTEDERRRVVEDARLLARTPAPRREAPTLPWASVRAAIGLAHGAPADAVEDCDRLYDG
jgi:hypothetical protein